MTTTHDIAIALLMKNQTVRVCLTGNCMKPFLRDNDLITIQPVEAGQLICGDVTVYRCNRELKVHRFLKMRSINGGNYSIIKADRRFRPDKPVPDADILGKVIEIRRGLKTIDYRKKSWERINFLLGRFSPFLSSAELPFYFVRKLLITAIKRILGDQKTGQIKKMLDR